MKKAGYICLIMIFLCSLSCIFPNVIWAKEDTIKTVLGKWRHVDLARTVVRSLEFKITEKGDSIVIWTFKKTNANSDNTSQDTGLTSGRAKFQLVTYTKITRCK